MSKDATYTRRINLYINGKQVENNISSIKKEMMKLVAAQSKMTIGSRDYVEQGKKIQTLNGILKQHRASLNQAETGWRGLSGAADKFNKYFGVISAGLASLTGVIFSFKKATDIFLELDEKLADVMKTTGLTKEEVKQLNVELAKINTRTSQQELLDLARVAGKLGISAQEDIIGFVRASDQVAVALSEDLGGNVEEAVNQLGKLVDIFDIKDEFGIEQAMLKIGSTINSLGAAGTANEGYMVEFAKRVGGVAPMAGISIDKVMGLASTLDELGQTAEVSGTTYSQVVGAMFKDTGKFAKVAGMGVEEFTKLLGKDANEAFIKVLEGAKGTSGGFAELAQNLDGLGIDGARSTAVLGVLANNIDKLRENQAYANEEFEKGTSLTEEFNIKNNTAKAELEKARKEVTRLAAELGEKLVPYMSYATVGFSKFIALMINGPKWIKENQVLLIALGGALLAYNSAIITSTALLVRDKAVRLASLALDKMQIMWRTAQVVGMQAWIAVTGKATIAQLRWIASMRAMGAAMLMNPVGIFIAGLTALYLALKTYDKYNADAVRREKERKLSVDNLSASNKLLSSTYDEINKQMQNLSSLSIQEKKDLHERTKETLKLALAELKLQKTKQENIQADNTKLNTWQFVKNSILSMGDMSKMVERSAKDAFDNGTEAAETMTAGLEELRSEIERLTSKKGELDDIFNAEALGDAISGETLANLEDKLSKYQTALKYAALGGEDFIRIQQKIADTQKLMNGFSSPDSPEATQAAVQDDSKELERLNAEKLKLEEKLASEIKGIRQALRLSEFSEEDQELINLKAKHADLLAEFEAHGLNTFELKQLQERELMQLVGEQEDKRLKLKAEVQQRIDALTATENQKAIAETKQKYTELIALAEEHGLETAELYRLMNEELALLDAEIFPEDRPLFGMTDEQWEELFAKFEVVMQFMNQIGSLWGSINKIMDNKDQKELMTFEKRQTRQRDLLSDRLEKGVITQEQYTARVAKLDAELQSKKEEIQKKQAERAKKLALFEVAINTASGIMGMLANPSGVAGIVLAALVGVAGIAQAAAINSAPPAYVEGGFTNGDRIYRAGEEGKEWIGNNKMVNDPYTGPIIAGLEAIQRGKAPATMFAPAMPNFDEMVALPAFAAGGYAGQGSTPTPVSITPQAAPNNEMIGQLLNEVVLLRTYLSDPLNRQAYISNNTLSRQATEDAMRNKLGRIE